MRQHHNVHYNNCQIVQYDVVNSFIIIHLTAHTATTATYYNSILFTQEAVVATSSRSSRQQIFCSFCVAAVQNSSVCSFLSSVEFALATNGTSVVIVKKPPNNAISHNIRLIGTQNSKIVVASEPKVKFQYLATQ